VLVVARIHGPGFAVNPPYGEISLATGDLFLPLPVGAPALNVYCFVLAATGGPSRRNDVRALEVCVAGHGRPASGTNASVL